jgi:hypothetical protein
MKIKRYLLVALTILITSSVMAYILSYKNHKLAEDQLKNEKPIFAYNSARFPKGKLLTVRQAAQFINTAETAHIFNFISGKRIIGTIQGENYKSDRRTFNIKNINGLNTPKRNITGDIKYIDMAERAKEFYYGKAIDNAMNDRFIYKVGELAGIIDNQDAELTYPGVESRYTVKSNNAKKMVLSTVIENACHDGTSTTVTYTLKNINGKWLIAEKKYSPRSEGNKMVTITSKGYNWFIVGSTLAFDRR